MPSLAEHSTAPILVFDSDGGIRACNRALGEMFGYAAGDLVGTSFGRLLDMPSHDQPRLFRRSDGQVRALTARPRDGRRFHLHAALSTLDWHGDRLRVASCTTSPKFAPIRSCWRSPMRPPGCATRYYFTTASIRPSWPRIARNSRRRCSWCTCSSSS